MVEWLDRGPRGGRVVIHLASSSPRRRALLRAAGLRYRLVRPDYEERPIRGATPRRLVRTHAWGKALSAAPRVKNGLILAADTVVAFRGRTIGKPRDMADAVRTLRSLQGRWHAVYTGVALAAMIDGRVAARAVYVEKTLVRLRPMEEADIRRYFRKISPLDKAGAYAIQSTTNIVAQLRGSFSNAVGLPMESLASRIRKLNLIMTE